MAYMTRYDAMLSFFMHLCNDLSIRWNKTLKDTALLFKKYGVFERVDYMFETYNESGIENAYKDIEYYVTIQGGSYE